VTYLTTSPLTFHTLPTLFKTQGKTNTPPPPSLPHLPLLFTLLYTAFCIYITLHTYARKKAYRAFAALSTPLGGSLNHHRYRHFFTAATFSNCPSCPSSWHHHIPFKRRAPHRCAAHYRTAATTLLPDSGATMPTPAAHSPVVPIRGYRTFRLLRAGRRQAFSVAAADRVEDAKAYQPSKYTTAISSRTSSAALFDTAFSETGRGLATTEPGTITKTHAHTTTS